MRSFLHIDLENKSINREELEGESIARAGRYLIAKTLLESGKATCDPLSPDNPLIFSTGPFAGTNFSNANRTSVGCKSPLTGGVKEANTGGTFGFALGQLHLAGLTLYGACDEWTIIHIAKDGSIRFDPADDYLGMGNFETAAKLHAHYGNKVSLALCGPVGEYQGLLAGISFSDVDLRPSRLAARGGVGAVMGSKKVKAVVLELNKMPKLHDRKKFMGSVKQYNALLDEQDPVHTMRNLGTAFMADVQNHMGGIPVRNFSAGQFVNTDEGTMTMGGEFIRQQNLSRGGETTHACMPGCTIECSNVYVDADGNEIASPIEYETLGLMGTNCGLNDPDDLARVNFIANDLGVDTIETGAMIAVLMEAGLGEFGDVDFMRRTLAEIAQGSDDGRLWATGTARVGAHYGVRRIPVIKRQAISAYDPRVVEVTGITMMVTAQGADHTAGNVPTMDCTDKSLEEMVAASLEAQVLTAAADSLGLCMFGRSVTNTRIDFVVNAINDALGTTLTPEFFSELGSDVLKLEDQFNAAAGFSVKDDELPDFFYNEPVAPTNKVARIHGPEIRQHLPH
ncbi:MAG: aldehyde ferredoxin oxidoreductase C-terminal domain-containing protein [Pseudomonadota bacterium]|nr:aldehyde ferredoxin oxidoreductase C-terminal domain-containing protein [Pseudomonadota bacterium]